MAKIKVKIPIEFECEFIVDNTSIVPRLEVIVNEKYNSQTFYVIKNNIKLIHKDDCKVNNYIGQIGDYFIVLNT